MGQIITYELADSIDDGASLGECMAGRNTIRIDRKLKGQIRNSTVLHEEIEMLNAKLDIELTHQQIIALETGIMSIKEVRE